MPNDATAMVGGMGLALVIFGIVGFVVSGMIKSLLVYGWLAPLTWLVVGVVVFIIAVLIEESIQ